MTGVHQLEQNRQVCSVEGADAVIQSASHRSRTFRLAPRLLQGLLIAGDSRVAAPAEAPS